MGSGQRQRMGNPATGPGKRPLEPQSRAPSRNYPEDRRHRVEWRDRVDWRDQVDWQDRPTQPSRMSENRHYVNFGLHGAPPCHQRTMREPKSPESPQAREPGSDPEASSARGGGSDGDVQDESLPGATRPALSGSLWRRRYGPGTRGQRPRCAWPKRSVGVWETSWSGSESIPWSRSFSGRRKMHAS